MVCTVSVSCVVVSSRRICNALELYILFFHNDERTLVCTISRQINKLSKESERGGSLTATLPTSQMHNNYVFEKEFLNSLRMYPRLDHFSNKFNWFS
jgi:hypothetical protein